MGLISDTAKKIAFWNYSRTSWQWDVLCVVILAFIFLTPKSWFVSNTPLMTTVVWASEIVGNQSDTTEIDRVAKGRLKRPAGQVIDRRPKRDDSGKVIAYEVDIR